MLGPVKLNPPADPRPRQAHQRRLDHLVVVNEVIAVGFIQRPLNPSAQLRQYHHPQVVIFQKDCPVAFILFRILNPVNHGQRINLSAGSLINPLFEKHGIPVRFSASVGRNQNILLPDLRPVCQLVHACFPLFSDLIIIGIFKQSVFREPQIHYTD